MLIMVVCQMINERPLKILDQLQRVFLPADQHFSWPVAPVQQYQVPLGIEIEVPWRAYFPDLFVAGFPNVSADEMARITVECSRREAVLVPKLEHTVACGLQKGKDRYWEFAFDPVTNAEILVQQINVLQKAGLCPSGAHSLQITFGGLRITRDVYYLALILESLCCSPERILQGFHPTNLYGVHGWSKKGIAGVHQKMGACNLLHGYGIAVEIRTLQMPETLEGLRHLFRVAHHYGEQIRQKQEYESVPAWDRLVTDLSGILKSHGLPDENWRAPHQRPEVWKRFAFELPLLSQKVETKVNENFCWK